MQCRVIECSAQRSNVVAPPMPPLMLTRHTVAASRVNADTLNTFGRLKQTQGERAEAERLYLRSLKLRQAWQPPASGADAVELEQLKQHAIAQSLVSLGNLQTEMADAEMASDAGSSADGAGAPSNETEASLVNEVRQWGDRVRAEATGTEDLLDEETAPDEGLPMATRRYRYAKARSYLEAAATAYVRGSSTGDMHPKVAWAYEGLGRLHEKEGNLQAALSGYERATQILSALQAHSDGKEMFQKELGIIQERQAALLQRTQRSRSRSTLNAGSGPSPTRSGTAAASTAEQETVDQV